jgi:hypothetical protein
LAIRRWLPRPRRRRLRPGPFHTRSLGRLRPLGRLQSRRIALSLQQGLLLKLASHRTHLGTQPVVLSRTLLTLALERLLDGPLQRTPLADRRRQHGRR